MPRSSEYALEHEHLNPAPSPRAFFDSIAWAIPATCNAVTLYARSHGGQNEVSFAFHKDAETAHRFARVTLRELVTDWIVIFEREGSGWIVFINYGGV